MSRWRIIRPPACSPVTQPVRSLIHRIDDVAFNTAPIEINEVGIALLIYKNIDVAEDVRATVQSARGILQLLDTCRCQARSLLPGSKLGNIVVRKVL